MRTVTWFSATAAKTTTRIKSRRFLKLFLLAFFFGKKEWYLDQEEGTPYREEVLGKGTEASSLRAIQERILETPGVIRLKSFDANQDPETRHATFTVEIETEYGEVTINA